jgi:carboxypeptidase Taq
MVRFELEKGLIEGTLNPKDLPELWNEKMREYLGITPASNMEGCLQDVHWSMGAIGYFPTYTLGNLYAAQFFSTFTKTDPHWQERVSEGNLSEIRLWLAQEIHRFGRQYPPGDLCKKVTGLFLSEKPFLDYLQQKYKALYHLS